MAWTASLALAYFCKRNLKNETQEIQGVDKIMEKSMQSPLAVTEFPGGSELVLVHPFFFFFFKANANAVSLKKQKITVCLGSLSAGMGWDGIVAPCTIS